METPSSTRRITRSQTMALSNSANKNINFPRNIEDSQKKGKTTSKQDRSPLIDISNDSPIVGLASGNFITTPLSSVAKQRSKNCCKKTPGSGEALLRGQVKNLLQKVEEEAEIPKVSFKSCGLLRHEFKAIFNSPAALVAPTPVNTPQVLNFSDVEDFDSFSFVSEPPIEDQLKLPKVINGIIDGEKMQTEASSGSENDLISRTLFLEFSEKSDSSTDCSSVVTYQGTTEVNSKSEEKIPSTEEDDASIWSIQANASTQDDEDEYEYEVTQVGVEFDENYADNDEYYDVKEEDDIPDLDELCEGINNMSVDGKNKGPKFMGKHIRFVYNSDDELVEECEEDDSDGILHLKGLPTPKGNHVRFQDEDGEEN